MEVKVLNQAGQDTGRTVNLPEDVFGIQPNQQALYLDIKQYLANQRQGTHKSKERAEIARTTKKLKKQKGTGGARAGSMKSPVFVGGGRVFGPRPRDYSFKLNRKLKQLARRSALSAKTAAGVLTVVEDFNIATPSTKSYISFLGNLQATGKKVLHVTAEAASGLVLSSRNLPKAKVTTADSINTYDVINADHIVLSEQSVAKLVEQLKA